MLLTNPKMDRFLKTEQPVRRPAEPPRVMRDGYIIDRPLWQRQLTIRLGNMVGATCSWALHKAEQVEAWQRQRQLDHALTQPQVQLMEVATDDGQI